MEALPSTSPAPPFFLMCIVSSSCSFYVRPFARYFLRVSMYNKDGVDLCINLVVYMTKVNLNALHGHKCCGALALFFLSNLLHPNLSICHLPNTWLPPRCCITWRAAVDLQF
jgi:hypothetical protein